MISDPIYEPKGRAREYAPLALNLYRGCSHGCRYCYAPAATRKQREAFSDAKPRLGVIEAAERQLKRCVTPSATKKIPVLLCFTCDAYQHCDDEFKLARNAIEVLHRHGHGVHVLTKGGMRAARDFDVLGQNTGDAYAATLTFVDDAQSSEWEPNAATPSDRLLALQEAHRRGITTWASLEPVIDCEQSLELIRIAAPFVDLFKVGRWNYDKRASEIDWRLFGRKAVSLLESIGRDYYIKNDLRAAMI